MNLHLRDRVITASCPWPDGQKRCRTYRNEVTALSASIDEDTAGELEKIFENIAEHLWKGAVAPGYEEVKKDLVL